ncbi:MAG: ferrochelatase [Rubricoccaceae bacterium]|nr:ferrochelatase [Rubricoccaceae bacterium]
MTAREFLNGFKRDERLVTGAYFGEEPVHVEPGETVGVVLMNGGGPTSVEAIEPYLYNVLMDPAVVDLPVPRMMRDRLCRLLARRQARAAGKDYEQIGGSSPLNRLTEEQARALEVRLNGRFGAASGVRFRTYAASRYWRPSSEAAARRMAQDGVDKVVLLPLYPQYSKTTTGTSLAYWKALEERKEIPTWPTSFVYEYAAHPKLVQALSERIDEGLQRFPATVRPRVHLLFSAPATAQKELSRWKDPYCCLVHSTVQQVMAHREGHDPARAFEVAFRGLGGAQKRLTPSTTDTLERLADDGQTAVLLVPVAFVSDHDEAAFALDIAIREQALRDGIEHYEVTSGLNCHPLFIEALAECVAAQLSPTAVSRGDGADVLPAAVPALPRYTVSRRTVRCHQCPFVTEAHDWSGEPAVHVPAPVASPASSPTRAS